MPLNKKIVPMLIVISVLLAILEGGWKHKLKNYNHFFFYITTGLYVLHLIGILYSEDKAAAMFDIQQKLSLVLFPIIFFADNLYYIKDKILKSFVVACILAGIICLINAFYHYYISFNSDSFFYSQFSVIMHASYFAMYLCFSIAVLLFNPNIIKNKIFKYVAIAFMTLLIVLTSSKSGVLAMLTLYLLVLIRVIYIEKSVKKAILGVSVMVAAGLILFVVYPKSVIRLIQMKNTIEHHDNSELNTTSSRIVIWKHSLHIIANNLWIGVGTGDKKSALKKEYNKSSEYELTQKNLNAHNQYLQTFIGLGLPGIVLLLSVLGALLYKSYITQNHEGILMALLIGFNLLFESMFETQAGVVFIAFFISYFLSISKNKSQETIFAS